MKANSSVIMCAILGIVCCECVALIMGIDGIILTAVIATLAGLGGWVLPSPKLK